MRKKERNSDEMTDRTIHKKAAISAKPQTILEAFENIVELAEDSNLSPEFFGAAQHLIIYAARKLSMTPIQVVLFAIFVDRSEDSRIFLSEIANYTGCRTTRMLRFADKIDDLEKRRYLRAARTHNSVSYRVPFEVIQALRHDKPYEHVVEPVRDTFSFFDSFNLLMTEKQDDEMTYSEISERTEEMLEEIKDSVFARELSGYPMDKDEKLLFIFMAYLFVENNDNNIGFRDIQSLYDGDKIPSWCRDSLRYHRSILFIKGLIENVNEDGMARGDAFKLTDKAKEEVLVELNLQEGSKSTNGLIKHSSFSPKSLIYNETEQSQISQLSAILTERKFKKVQERLRSAGMREGFCCLFYGAPGTGKTETVNQLARLTGRDIMRVDVDKIKSCWVGESEKNIKAIFTRYRNICKNPGPKPILLFNEADAVLGVRMEGAEHAVDKMENSIQNIILQEMETLDGIMIATTNLTTNLDKAFERRFLYKIRFDKPTFEARTKIWQTMMKGLKRKDARILASRFDLSGGEIENIVRKQSVNAILSGKEAIDMNALSELCAQERIAAASRIHIGFH